MLTRFEYQEHRNSYTELNAIYFWTITINKWIGLLQDDDFKFIIIDSLKWLCDKDLIRIYGYVIMPNHIHLIWQQLKMSGKELPKNNFEKFTAHQFQKKLRLNDLCLLEKFKVNASDRNYNFWQRDPLAIYIYNRKILEQKLNYIHNNPLQSHWSLCSIPEQYRFSSANFYENGIDEFGIVTNYIHEY